MNRKYFLFALGSSLAFGLGCRTAAPEVAKPEKIRATQTTRSNCYSLLYDLLGDERNVSKILIIKSERVELKDLIKRISETAGRGADQIKAFAQADATLSLETTMLPAGEKATRDAIAKSRTHELLHTSGQEFEENLLLTQIESMGYAQHLAKVAATFEPNARQVSYLHGLSEEFGKLRGETIALLRSGGK